MAAIDPNCDVNWHYKDDYIRVRIDVPGLKTQFAGIGKRKLDPESADLTVSFEDNIHLRIYVHEVLAFHNYCAFIEVTLKQGTKKGTIYRKTLDKDDLKDSLVSPEPASYYKVVDDEVRLYIRKR